MISFIRGNIVDIYLDRIVLESGNIGYNINVSSKFINNIREKYDIKIFTYLSVKEDSMTLFGFETKEELELFKLLISVSGIGPKGALGILSTLSVDQLRMAIISDDSKAISKSPGIGSKTASKIIIELKDKLKVEDIFVSKNETKIETNVSNDISKEAIEALIALGYSPSIAFATVNKINSKEYETVEELIKLSLKHMI